GAGRTDGPGGLDERAEQHPPSEPHDNDTPAPNPATRLAPTGGERPDAYDRPVTQPAALGLLLAAGGGSRMGQPKALVIGADGRPWLPTAVDALRDGGCDHILVVLGAAAQQAERLIAELAVTTVVAEDWEQGMSASLQAGLSEARRLEREFGAVAISLVDLPDVDSRVVARVLDKVGTDPTALGRAVYDGSPGHPVVISADHIAGVL